MATDQRLGTARDLPEVGQVKLDDARRPRPTEARRGRAALGRIAHRQHDVGTASDQVTRRFETDAAVGAGHHHGAPGLLGQNAWVPAHTGSLRTGESRMARCGTPHPTGALHDVRDACLFGVRGVAPAARFHRVPDHDRWSLNMTASTVTASRRTSWRARVLHRSSEAVVFSAAAVLALAHAFDDALLLP